MRGLARWRSDVLWASPQVLLTGFLFALALLFALAGGAERGVPPPPEVVVDPRPSVQRQVELRYVVVDVQGLERPGYADVGMTAAAADDLGARLAAALGAMRDDLAAGGVWPAPIPAPSAYVIDLDRRRLAVVDVAAAPADARFDVAVELAVVRSLIATARVAVAADEVRITVAGAESPSLWGRVALGGD
jgi:hypothetical protein